MCWEFTFQDVNVDVSLLSVCTSSALMNLRSTYKDAILEKHGIKFGFMSGFVKACTIALKEIPSVNASIEEDGSDKNIVYRDYADISVAVSTPKVRVNMSLTMLVVSLV